MQSAGAGGDLRADDIIAELSADVLLGDKDRSALTLVREEFAGGYADLTVHNGLLLAEYCAIDNRYIQVAGPVLRPSRTPVLSSSIGSASASRRRVESATSATDVVSVPRRSPSTRTATT